MRWVGDVARTGRRGAAGFGGDNGGRERDHLEDLSVNGRIY